MSNAKLKVEVGYMSNTHAGSTYRPATTAEIMDAHPRCSQCRHLREVETAVFDGYFQERIFCNKRSNYEPAEADTFYCRHWEAKG